MTKDTKIMITTIVILTCAAYVVVNAVKAYAVVRAMEGLGCND